MQKKVQKNLHMSKKSSNFAAKLFVLRGKQTKLLYNIY